MSDAENTNQKLRPVLVIVFFIIISGLAYAGVQLVQWAPSGLDRVATLAERVNDSQQTILDFGEQPDVIILTENTRYTTSGETIELTWPTNTESGVYFFTYSCKEGISVALVLEGEFTAIACSDEHNVGATNNITAQVTSTADRYADLEYTITFKPGGNAVATAVGSAMITIVNDEVSTLFADNSTPTPPTPTITDVAITSDFGFTSDADVPTPEVAGATTDTPSYTPIDTVISIIPPSDDSGHTDLAVKFIAAGNIVNDTFFVQDIIKDHRGAVQFEVKNLGTKTSDDWTYSLTLPNGSTHTSPEQAPLKPNERALITVGFPTPAITDYQFTVTITTDRDQTALNDRFTRSVTLVN